MKKVFVFLVSMVTFCGVTYAQVDTLQHYPFLYYYNFPEILFQDSSDCEVAEGDCLYGNYCNGGYYGYEAALLQHTDVPLRVVGVAFGEVWENTMCKLSVYKYEMKEVEGVVTESFLGSWRQGDSNFHFFYIPKLNNVIPMSGPAPDVTCLKFAFFNSPFDLDSGDYYIGLALYDTATHTNRLIDFLPSFYERHLYPSHFESSDIRFFLNNTWHDCTLPPEFLPILFLIIEPECRMVEEVRVATDSAGCIGVEWDSLPWQTQWVVRLAGNGETQYDTVDTCHVTYCGLNPSSHYEVSVQSQCYRPGGHNWSEWSATVPLDNNGISAIEDGEHRLRLTPNPASGSVTVTADGVQGSATVALYDAGGAEVLRCERILLPHILSTDRLPAGVYLLRVEADTFSATEKLVIAR